MFSTAQRAIGAYTKIGIETSVPSASPQQLILMLYEGAIVAISSAQQHLRQNNIAAKGSSISRAISIIDGGLKASLDLSVGGELAKNLSGLYAYMAQRLLQANLKNDHAALEEVRQLLQQLKGAWDALAATPVAAAAGLGAAPPPRGLANTCGNI